MQRLRGMLAHGGIAVLAVVFALALAGFYLVNAFTFVVMSIFEQHLGDEEGPAFEVDIFDTELYLDGVVSGGLTLVLVAAALLAVWHITRRQVRSCPECLSEVPLEASVCRYCTADIARSEP